MFKFFRWLVRSLLFLTGAALFVRCGSGYKQKDGKTYYNGEEISNKDLVVLNDVFARDSIRAYYRGGAIEGAEPASFIALDNNYAKDSRRVWYCEEHRNAQDYFTTKKSTVRSIDGADALSFEALSSGYAKDRSLAYFEGDAFKVKDPASFHSISLYFSRDSIQAYFHGRPVKNSEGSSFEIINNHYARDTGHVYYYGYPSDAKNGVYAMSADRNTFSPLEYPYSRDSQRIFYEELAIRSASPGQFSILRAGFAKDGQSVFYQTIPVAGARPSSFEVFEQNETNTQEFYFAKDSEAVYYKERKIPQADRASFRILGLGYALDKNQVYYRSARVNGAHPTTFEVFEHGYGEADAKDDRRQYLEGAPVR